MDHVEKLRRILEVSGLTQEELASRVGVSFVSLNSWINGRSQPRRGALRAIDHIYVELAAGLDVGTSSAFASLPQGWGLPLQPPELLPNQVEQLLDGGGDHETIDVLWEMHYVKFLKCLVSVAELLPKDAMTSGLALLKRAYEANPATCKQALSYPHFTVWGSVLLQRILGTSTNGEIDDHLAHFSAIAASVAWQCGVHDFVIDVPIDHGSVVLPQLGRALLPESDAGFARVSCVAGELRITTSTETFSMPADPSRGTHLWEPIRSISVERDGLTLQVVIDDLDFYRAQDTTLGFVHPAKRLDELNFKAWKEHLTDAWALLVDSHREYAVGIAHGVRVMVPMEDAIRHLTGSYRESFGAIVSTVGTSPAWMAQSMLEEFQRMKVAVLDALLTLHTATSDARYFAPWSEVPQSFADLLAGFYSTVATAEFWGNYHHRALGVEQFEAGVNFSLRRSWEDALFHRLDSEHELTQLGHQLLAAIRNRSKRVNEEVPQAVIRLARTIAIDFRMCFRLTNLVCEQSDIQRLANAWQAGMACPVTASIRQSVQPSGIQLLGRKRRRLLHELLLAYPETFNEVIENDHYRQAVVPGATRGDALTVAERFDEAINFYSAAIMHDNRDTEAWTGLAIAAARDGNHIASTIGRLPEVVVALHQHLHATAGEREDPTRLAKWLEPLLLRVDDLAFEHEYTHEISNQF